jgi:hypothetical protein
MSGYPLTWLFLTTRSEAMVSLGSSPATPARAYRGISRRLDLPCNIIRIETYLMRRVANRSGKLSCSCSGAAVAEMVLLSTVAPAHRGEAGEL